MRLVLDDAGKHVIRPNPRFNPPAVCRDPRSVRLSAR